MAGSCFLQRQADCDSVSVGSPASGYTQRAQSKNEAEGRVFGARATKGSANRLGQVVRCPILLKGRAASAKRDGAGGSGWNEEDKRPASD
jgi:hypothetical protein